MLPHAHSFHSHEDSTLSLFATCLARNCRPFTEVKHERKNHQALKRACDSARGVIIFSCGRDQMPFGVTSGLVSPHDVAEQTELFLERECARKIYMGRVVKQKIVKKLPETTELQRIFSFPLLQIYMAFRMMIIPAVFSHLFFSS